ncbi:MAG: LysR family transcriptional regulator [Rhodobacteraceae bacterium]|nr:LysR family transcriptional regulator [Paracoccaceae bacterium]
MTSLPPLNALRAFDAAGRCLNFRIASEEIGVTQGAVAQQVRLLEDHLGLKLFERLPKGLAFTEAGRRYHGRVAEAFAGLRAATQDLRPGPERVLISVTPTFAAKWLIPNLPGFSESHPQIDLCILSTEKLSRFHGDGIDLAIRQGSPPFGAAIDAVMLFRQEIIAVAAPGFAPDPITPQVLAGLPKLHDAHDHWGAFLQMLGIQDTSGRGLQLNQTALALDAAIAGQGVALVSRFLAAHDISAGRLVQVSPQFLEEDKAFFLLAHRQQDRKQAVEIVWNWLLELADPEPSSRPWISRPRPASVR